MSHLAVTQKPAPRHRRMRRGAPIALVVLIAAALVGCSAGSGADAGGAVAEPGVVEGGGQAEDGGDADRSVIIEGTMVVVVEDVPAATADAISIVQGADGRIDGREEWHDGDGEESTSSTTLILRIPAPALDDAIGDLRELGDVQSLQTSTIDVTSDVEDVDARVDALESTIARLKTFQSETTSVSDLLSVEEEISQRQAELESYLTRQADLAEQISFSTITLSLHSEAAPPSAPDSFWSGLVVGWNAMMAFLAGLAVVLGVMLPWLVGLGLLAGAIVLIVRWNRRRRPAPPPPAPPAPAQAVPWLQGDPSPAPPARVDAGTGPPTP